MTHKIRSFAEDTYHEVPEPTVAQRAEAVLRADGRTEWESRRLHGLMYGDPIEQDGYDKLYGSASEADLALMALIALGTRDSEQIEQVARTSGRHRNKWDKHNSYLARTIARALDDSWAKYTKRHAAPPPEDEATRAAVTLTLAKYLKDPDALKPPVPTIVRAR